MRRALPLVLLVAVGCASAPGGPAATIGKVRAWWQEICGLGDSALGVAEHAAEVATADAGVNETGVSVNNAPSNVNSSGGEADASVAAVGDAPQPADASAPEASTAGGLE